MLDRYPRLFAFGFVVFFFALIVAYVREFRVLNNTIGAKGLVLGSILIVLALSLLALWRWRNRFTPVVNHLPEILFIALIPTLFAPLFGSWANRLGTDRAFESFHFVSETPYIASGYGVIQGEKLQPTGYYLRVKDIKNGEMQRFRYRKQAYYPMTKVGDTILLPVRKGWLGHTIVEME
jgi:hypothetical protein